VEELFSVDGFESEEVSITDMSLLDVSSGDWEELDLGDDANTFFVFLVGSFVELGEDIFRLGFPIALSNRACALIIIGFG